MPGSPTPRTPAPLIVPVDGRPLCPKCLGAPMERQGASGHRRRYRCRSCGASRLEGEPGRWPVVCDRLRLVDGAWEIVRGADGFRVSRDGRGRRLVVLGRDHPWANSAGWQYLARFLASDALGRFLHAVEQVHHRNGAVDDDRRENLEVLSVEFHGRLHAWAMELAGARAPDGRFRELEEGEFDSPAPIARWGAVLGRAALALIPQRERERERERESSAVETTG